MIAKLAQSLLFAKLIFMSAEMEAPDEGIIARYSEDGFPVVLKFVNDLPGEPERSRFRWLTVIAWKYDGTQNNGMPTEDANRRMIGLEEAIEGSVGTGGYCRHAYSRTGNNLKELVYYCENRERFLALLNESLGSHPRYPIEINFYDDPEWEDFRRVLAMVERE